MENLGPAMLALTDKQRKFVMYMFDRVNCTQTKAARLAGYSDPSNGHAGPSSSIRATSSQLMHNPKIIAAMKEYGQDKLGAIVPDAIRAIHEIVNDRTNTDRYKASKGALGLAGHTEIMQKNVTHVHVELTAKQQLTEIREYALKHGLDPRTLLGDVTDAEFEELPAPTLDPEDLSDLADLL